VDLITASLLLIGAGFLVANAWLAVDLLRFRRRRRSALLTWAPPPAPNQRLSLGLAIALGFLMVFKVFYLRRQAIGEVMMFLYFGLLIPMTRRIGRGFYADGIWSDSSFIPYNEVGGISWREGEHSVALIVTSRLRNLARRLTVPSAHYAAARRLLRDKIGDHEIHFSGTGLDLGVRDERDEA
jgi:hypothetical protein